MCADCPGTLCDHLDVRVRDLERARAFYDPVCAALGLWQAHPGGEWVVYETDDPVRAFLAITADPAFAASHSRIAFRARSAEDVERIAFVAKSSGAVDFEPPVLCPEYAEGYYASFFSDPDGNRYEICFRPHSQNSFAEALIAARPSLELEAHADDLAWLIGGWRAIVRDYDDAGVVEESSGEWWFSCVLEGRAMQDVWIVPPRDGPAKPRLRYGSTIRWFDAKSGLWRISWFNPVTGAHNDLSGGRHGNRLIFDGTSDGKAIRWSFNDITPSHFVWRGEDVSGCEPKVGSEFVCSRFSG
jgi:catechol 2,3-dioxygenase-like lactoylglutathione lyase family enzyme